MKTEVWRRRLKKTIFIGLGGATGLFVLLPLLQWGKHPYSEHLISGCIWIITVIVLGLLIPFIYDMCRKKSKYPKDNQKQ